MTKLLYALRQVRQEGRRLLLRFQDRIALSASEARALVVVLAFTLCGMVMHEVRLHLLPEPDTLMAEASSQTAKAYVPSGESSTANHAGADNFVDSLESGSTALPLLGQELTQLPDTMPLPLRLDDPIQSVRQSDQLKGSDVIAPDRISSVSGRIDINRATAEEFQSLPGIGPAIAQRIVDYRNDVGRFLTVEELLSVRGIGPKKFEQIQSRTYILPEEH